MSSNQESSEFDERALDRYLRRGLDGDDQRPTDAARQRVLWGTKRRHDRRLQLLGALGAGVVIAVALVVVVPLVNRPAGPQTATVPLVPRRGGGEEAPAYGAASAGPSKPVALPCVKVAAGSAAPRCAGSYLTSTAPGSNFSGSDASGSPSPVSPPGQVRSGQTIRFVLPRLPGLSWTVPTATVTSASSTNPTPLSVHTSGPSQIGGSLGGSLEAPSTGTLQLRAVAQCPQRETSPGVPTTATCGSPISWSMDLSIRS